MFVLMEVETLGVARSLGWKVHMRCANGYRQETRSMRRCVYRKQLDLETLVATRGPNFPLGRLEANPVYRAGLAANARSRSFFQLICQ
jgi:hypothetical protein